MSGVRLVCFASLIPDEVERFIAPVADPIIVMAGLADDRELWTNLRTDHELSENVAEAHQLTPDADALKHAQPEYWRAWIPLCNQLQVAYSRARQIAGCSPLPTRPRA
jgi:hypothetical protein